MPFIGELILDSLETGSTPQAHGNRVAGAAPHDAYPALGVDAWVAISVTNDAAWRTLAEIIGAPQLGSDARYATAAARWKNQDELREPISNWTRRMTKHEAAALLQAAGIAAAPVQDGKDIVEDPYLAARGFFTTLDHPEAGRRSYQGLPFKLSRTPGGQHRASPCLGEHTGTILRDILHLSESDIAALEQSGTLSNVSARREISRESRTGENIGWGQSMSGEAQVSTADVVLLERRDNVAWLTLNRPRVLNAINTDMRRLLTTLLKNLDQDPDVRAIVLGGAGRSFCAGNDLRESSEGDLALADERSEEYFLLYDTVPPSHQAADYSHSRPLHGRGLADRAAGGPENCRQRREDRHDGTQRRYAGGDRLKPSPRRSRRGGHAAADFAGGLRSGRAGRWVSTSFMKSLPTMRSMPVLVKLPAGWRSVRRRR